MKNKIITPLLWLIALVCTIQLGYANQAEKIKLVKEVSVDRGKTFFDANNSRSAPSAGLNRSTIYRLTATNTGTSDLENVVINDATLGIEDFLVGNLAARQGIVLTEVEIKKLKTFKRCLQPGDATNIATVKADSVDTGNSLMDSDPAVVRCFEEAIDLLKEVSVDGGTTFFDANDDISAPETVIGGSVLYRLTVANIGTTDLENIVLNDATLGIADFLVGNLAAGETLVLTEGEIPELEAPGRCEIPGAVTNIASIQGYSVDTGNKADDSDPAVVRCVEENIDLLKEVSVDGGTTFFDANDDTTAPVTAIGGNALYRFTVTNTGTSDLENVAITDTELEIAGFVIGNLAAGQTVVLTEGEIPALEQPGRCEIPGDVTNIATVEGDSVDTGNLVSDSDPAVVRCQGLPPCDISVIKQCQVIVEPNGGDGDKDKDKDKDKDQDIDPPSEPADECIIFIDSNDDSDKDKDKDKDKDND